jgi:hypothetical protein
MNKQSANQTRGAYRRSGLVDVLVLTIGIRRVFVHAFSLQAKAFYEQMGFGTLPLDPMTVMITLADLEAS